MKITDEDLDIWDATLATLPTDDKIALLQRMERAAFDYDSRIKLVPFCVYEDAITTKYLANSRGFAGQYGKTYAVSYLQAVGVDGDERAEAWDLGASVYFADLSPEHIGQAAARRVLTMLGGTPVPTQTCTVVFDALITAEILFYLSIAVNGEQVLKKRSFLLDQLGKEVASDNVSLMDNGRLKRSLGSRPFDDEGVPTSATRLMDEGTFQAVLHDSYSARRTGAQSTGNAVRGSHRQVPTVGINHLYLQPGHKSVDELIAGVQNGLYVTNIMQTGGIDPTNGDCSMAAYGTWIENGKLTRPVSGVTVATTLQGMLKNISDVGNDLRPVPMMGMISAPTIRVDNVTVGGTAQNGS
jgi:PmbA protein